MEGPVIISHFQELCNKCNDAFVVYFINGALNLSRYFSEDALVYLSYIINAVYIRNFWVKGLTETF